MRESEEFSVKISARERGGYQVVLKAKEWPAPYMPIMAHQSGRTRYWTCLTYRGASRKARSVERRMTRELRSFERRMERASDA